MRIQVNWDENQTPDLGRTRKVRVTVDKICKLGPERTRKARVTVDKADKSDPGRTEKARVTVNKAGKYAPRRAENARITVDIIHKSDFGESKSRDNP